MKQSKVGDFFVGVTAIAALDVFAFVLPIGPGLLDGMFGVLVCAEIGLVIAAITRERPFIALGIIVSALVPQMVFFACASISGHF